MEKAEAIAVVVTALDEVACEYKVEPHPHNDIITRASQPTRI